jgi:hypothetical protein
LACELIHAGAGFTRSHGVDVISPKNVLPNVTASLHLAILGIAFTPLSAQIPGQLPSPGCEASFSSLADCGFMARNVAVENAARSESDLIAVNPFDAAGVPRQNLPEHALSDKDDADNSGAVEPAMESPAKEGFHWGRALQESFTFLAIEQAYVVHDDFRWVVVENGIPFNHYLRDYMQSLTSWWKAGWSAGENPLYNYVGHPIQGAMTSYIEIQNNPSDPDLEFANTDQYWRSRLIATVWNAVYSTQWSLGPLSEMTVEKYGTKARPAWNSNGTWPCTTNHCYSGVGKVNLVMTPVGGLGWVLGEDWLDKNVARRVEAASDNRLLIDTVRCSLNPIRGGANILHGREPWYRARDYGPTNLTSEHRYTKARANALARTTAPETNSRLPDVWNIFAGYSYTNSEVVTGEHTPLSGWNVALEKKYLRFFGVVAEVSGQYGSSNVSASNCQTSSSPGNCPSRVNVIQNNYVTGIRGGHSLWRIHPYAQVLAGIAHVTQRTSRVSTSDTNFALDLGIGLDFRLAPRVGWRSQADYLTAGSITQTHDIRLSIGPAVHF